MPISPLKMAMASSMFALFLGVSACETSAVSGISNIASSAPNYAREADLPAPAIGDRAVTPFDEMDAESQSVIAMLREQEAAWNNGNIPAYMDYYWRSEHLRYASGGTVSRGWAQTLTRYMARYPDSATMGRLEFRSMEVVRISQRTVIVHGQWSIDRVVDKPWGLFTLVVRRIDGEWKIVSDTTTISPNAQ